MKYLNGTRELVLTLSAYALNILKWNIDASFAVHADFKSHTGNVYGKRYNNDNVMKTKAQHKE